MHPRHRKHGSEKGTAFGGGVSLEPATKNLVEVCSVAERAVLDGAALSVSAISTGEMDGRNNQKYGSGRVARNSLLWLGTGCGTANGKLAWGPFPICRHVGYRQNVGLPTAALAAKLYTSAPQNTAEALKRQITLQRGHWFETGVHQALTGCGLSPLSQLEIEMRHKNIPIKAHLDFTLVTAPTTSVCTDS